MLIIKTYLKEVSQKGIGLFSHENLSKGSIVWIEESNFSKSFLDEDFLKMSEVEMDFIMHYATHNFMENGQWFMDLDNTRFMNHSNNPNILFKGKYGYALVDIKAGKELTCDYRTIGDTEDIDFTKYI